MSVITIDFDFSFLSLGRINIQERAHVEIVKAYLSVI